MKLVILTFFITLAYQIGHTQLVFNKTKHDFGDLASYSDRFFDVVLLNSGSKKEYILSVKKPREVVYIATKQFIEKDSSTILRFQVNPTQKGKFNYTIDVYTSDRAEPTKVIVKGSLQELTQNDMSSFSACPDFNERPIANAANKFDLTVVTIDKSSREVLDNSTVTLLQNGTPVWENKTDKKGEIKENSTLGFSYFYATHEGYFPSELGAYVNFKRNYVVVELEKRPITEEPIVLTEVPTEDLPETIISIEIDKKLENELKKETMTEIAPTPSELAALDKDNFDDKYFKPVNIVFVLDISSSMRQADKLELMKYALYQLTDMLRPQDKVSIVTYASSSKVLIKAASGSKKEEIKKAVSELEASGYTAGGEGIKLGFKQAYESKIPQGTNQVIIITDGAFNKESKDYMKAVKKYRKKGINLSVVGIKNKDVDREKMIATAEEGGGHYIPIHRLSDANSNLIQEIRLLSFRYNE